MYLYIIIINNKNMTALQQKDLFDELQIQISSLKTEIQQLSDLMDIYIMKSEIKRLSIRCTVLRSRFFGRI